MNKDIIDDDSSSGLRERIIGLGDSDSEQESEGKFQNFNDYNMTNKEFTKKQQYLNKEDLTSEGIEV